jgi:hypothetical protein
MTLPPLDADGIESNVYIRVSDSNKSRLTIVLQGCEDCVEELGNEIADLCSRRQAISPCGGCGGRIDPEHLS